jgi:PAS domain S-box-containing protein
LHLPKAHIARYLLTIVVVMNCIPLFWSDALLWSQSSPVPDTASASSSLTNSQGHRPVIVADDSAYAPFSFLDANGQPRGFTIDLWRLWSRRTGIPVEFRLMRWEDALQAVHEGRADALGGVCRTQEREAWLDFIGPTLDYETSIFFHHQMIGVNTLDDLPGFTVGVIRGDSSVDFIRTQRPDVNLRLYDSVEEMVGAAGAGEIKVFVADAPVALHYFGKSSGDVQFRKTHRPLQRNLLYIGIRKGDPALSAEISSGFRNIPKEEVAKLKNAWIGIPVRVAVPWRQIGIWLGILLLATILVLVWNLHLRRRIRIATHSLSVKHAELKAAHESFLEHDARRKILFDNSPEAYMILTDGVFTDCNRTAEILHGRSRDQILGHTPAQLSAEIQPSGQASVDLSREHIEGVRPGDVSTFEWVIRKPDGVEVPVEISISRVGLDNREVVFSSLRDITERKQTEEELKRRESYLSSIIENQPGLVWLKDSAGRFLAVNRAFAGSCGVDDPASLAGKTDYDIWPRELAEKYRNDDGAVMRSGDPRTVEEPILDHGVTTWFETFKTPIRDASGAIIGTTGFARDITVRKQVEEALRDSQSKLSALFAAMTEMVALHELVFDEAGTVVDYRIIDCNNAFTGITGIPRDQAVGILATQLYNAPEAPYLKEYAQVAQTGEPHRFETFYAPMGKHFAISAVSPGPNRFATVTSDITEIKQTQQLLHTKNRELEQLIYVASHDLRSPLVNVDGYARELEYLLREIEDRLIAAEPDPDPGDRTIHELDDALRHIRNSARHMDALLKGLLKLSRTGRSSITIAPLDMNMLVSQAALSLEYQANQAGAAIRIGNLPDCLGDEVQTTQVFINLINNAIKYLDPSRPGVISISGSSDQTQSVYMVEDNGIGIAPEYQEVVFELFHRLDPNASEGEGLGLTIIRQILGRLDGHIWLESEPGVGSKFYVKLPSASKTGNP